MAAKKKTTTTNERRSSPATAARGAAVRRLIEAYPEAWGEFLREEREKAGLPAEIQRQSRIQKFVSRMQQEGVEADVIAEALAAAGFKAK